MVLDLIEKSKTAKKQGNDSNSIPQKGKPFTELLTSNELFQDEYTQRVSITRDRGIRATKYTFYRKEILLLLEYYKTVIRKIIRHYSRIHKGKLCSELATQSLGFGLVRGIVWFVYPVFLLGYEDGGASS